MRRPVLAGLCLLALVACEHRGNLRSAADYPPIKAPAVKQPLYDPYAAYGSAPARWRPEVADRRGTIVRPGWGDLPPVSGRPPGTF